jgi:hypothetical protein
VSSTLVPRVRDDPANVNNVGNQPDAWPRIRKPPGVDRELACPDFSPLEKYRSSTRTGSRGPEIRPGRSDVSLRRVPRPGQPAHVQHRLPRVVDDLPVLGWLRPQDALALEIQRRTSRCSRRPPARYGRPARGAGRSRAGSRSRDRARGAKVSGITPTTTASECRRAVDVDTGPTMYARSRLPGRRAAESRRAAVAANFSPWNGAT